MGLLTTILIASAIKGAVKISENVAEAAVAKSAAEADARAAEARAAAQERAAEARIAANERAQSMPQPQYAPKTNPQIKNNQYDIVFFYAKVAIIAYIAKADNQISLEEKNELDQMIVVARSMYGSAVADKAVRIINNESNSFMALEPYLRKVQDRDLESFLFYADEIARTDNKLTAGEENSLKTLRSYIDSRKGKKEIHDLICPSCGGHMHSDEYGFKAVCQSCGRESIINSDNSPYKVNAPTTCASCGRSLAKFDNPKSFAFCPYCGGSVYSNTGPAYVTPQQAGRGKTYEKGPNLYISYNTINSSVGLETTIVSTGAKRTYYNGQLISFRLPTGNQTILLKIGNRSYSRDRVNEKTRKYINSLVPICDREFTLITSERPDFVANYRECSYAIEHFLVDFCNDGINNNQSESRRSNRDVMNIYKKYHDTDIGTIKDSDIEPATKDIEKELNKINNISHSFDYTKYVDAYSRIFNHHYSRVDSYLSNGALRNKKTLVGFLIELHCDTTLMHATYNNAIVSFKGKHKAFPLTKDIVNLLSAATKLDFVIVSQFNEGFSIESQDVRIYETKDMDKSIREQRITIYDIVNLPHNIL